MDPVIDASLPQQNTGYTYSGNNPTTYMDPSGKKFAFDHMTPGGGWNMGVSLPPGHQRFANEGARLSKAVKEQRSNPVLKYFDTAKQERDLRLSRFYSSEQGQLLLGWLSGTSPRYLSYDASSQMTSDISGSDAVRAYRARIAEALARGNVLPNGAYTAGAPTLANPNLIRDGITLADLDRASSADLTMLTLGSFDLHAYVVERTEPHQAVVSITATNTTSLGSMLRFSDQMYVEYNELAPSIGLGPVTETFTWTETIRW